MSKCLLDIFTCMWHIHDTSQTELLRLPKSVPPSIVFHISVKSNSILPVAQVKNAAIILDTSVSCIVHLSPTVLLALSSKYIQNMKTSHHPCSQLPDSSHHHLLPRLFYKSPLLVFPIPLLLSLGFFCHRCQSDLVKIFRSQCVTSLLNSIQWLSVTDPES